MIPNLLTIAGSDPSGGAGIQADLKTFSALGGYGMAVISALTAQNTQGVSQFLATPTEMLIAQLDALFSDIRIDSLKTGMLATSQIVVTLVEFLQQRPYPFLVVDTVMLAKGGHPLIDQQAIETIRTRLLPLADLITPNLPEAAALLNCQEAANIDEMIAQGYALLQFGCKAVLIKGGHLTDADSPDILVTPQQHYCFTLPRLPTRHTHGTGCTLSAAITALQPHVGLLDAVDQAKRYLYDALQQAERLEVGHGIGPTHHFHHWW